MKYLLIAATMVLSGCITVYQPTAYDLPGVKQGYYPDPINMPGYVCGKGVVVTIYGVEDNYDCWQI